MKSKEELNALKEEVESVNQKLSELTEEELAEVTGSLGRSILRETVISISRETLGIE